jgi:hypothetical protein
MIDINPFSLIFYHKYAYKKARKHSVFGLFRQKVAERVGFEPTDGYQPSHDFESCALGQLSHLSI